MYNLFISNSWTYSDSYKQLVKLLEETDNFEYRVYLVPGDDPCNYALNQSLLIEAIKEQMSNSNCILILAGVYSIKSKWINIEIELAKNGFRSPKNIIAIEPWESERTSQIVKASANEIVKWDNQLIIDAIRRQCIETGKNIIV